VRIISNKKDYYDGFMNHDKRDYNNKVFVRCEEIVKINKEALNSFEDRRLWLNSRYHSHNFLIVAGKVYPFIEVDEPSQVYSDNNVICRRKACHNFYYDAVTYENEHGIKNSGYRYLFNKNDLEKFFNEPYPDMTNLCVKVGTPIILISPSKGYYEEKGESLRNCLINVNLKDLSFSKIMKASTLFQEIDLFISNVMVNDNIVQSYQTDIEKVEAHGFDKKLSFRKTRQ
jgi:hypothetical protein